MKKRTITKPGSHQPTPESQPESHQPTPETVESNQPTPETPETAETSSIYDEHLEDLNFHSCGEGDGVAGECAADSQAVQAPPGCVSKEIFRKSFSGIQNIGGQFLNLKSLAVAPESQGQADLAADAIYETAVEIHWLEFLIKPGNPWLGRLFAIGSFMLPKFLMIKMELQARNQEQKPANDNPEQATGGATSGLEAFPTKEQEEVA